MRMCVEVDTQLRVHLAIKTIIKNVVKKLKLSLHQSNSKVQEQTSLLTRWMYQIEKNKNPLQDCPYKSFVLYTLTVTIVSQTQIHIATHRMTFRLRV